MRLSRLCASTRANTSRDSESVSAHCFSGESREWCTRSLPLLPAPAANESPTDTPFGGGDKSAPGAASERSICAARRN